MSGNFLATKKSDDEIRQFAQATRVHYKPRAAYPLQIVDILTKNPAVPTVFGSKQLFYRIVDDINLAVEGQTEFTEQTRVISVRKSVHERAKFGIGRDRFTLAHELGHAVLHNGAPKARSMVRNTPSFVKPFENAEHQADIFASAFLIDDVIAAQLGSAEDIEIEFAVSAKAAEICFERLHKVEIKQELAKSFRLLSDELKRYGSPLSPPQTDTATSCPRCSNKTLIEIGVKYFCTSCEFICNPIGDGDPLP